jgi:hypothetical protein
MPIRRLACLLAALPVAAALAAPGLMPSTAHAAAAPWTRPIGSGSLPTAGIGEPYSSPAVGDLFGNGQKEIVTGSLDGWVRAFSSGGQPLWANQTGGAIQSSPTLANLRGDGQLEVIVTSRNGFVNVYNANGTPFGANWPQRATFVRPFSNTDFVPDFFASAAVASLYGDGNLDVVATSWDHRLYVWNANGNALPGFPINLWDTVWDTPLLVDLEGNGQRDIVVGSDSNGGVEPNPKGGVWWAFRPDGSLIWKRLQDEVPWSSPAAAILNAGDAQPSIVGGTGHYFAQTVNAAVGRYVNVFNANGSDRFGHPLSTPSQNFASPALGDLLNRGDGSREIVQITENQQVYAWDGNGNLLPGWPVTPTNGTQLGSPIIAPVGGACGTGNGVWIPGWYHLLGYCSNGALGADIATSTANPPFTAPAPVTAAPTVADLGNGQLSLIAAYQNNLSNNSWTLGVWPLAGTTTMPAGAWPTFHGNAQRTGTPAVVPDPRNRAFVNNLYHDVLGRSTAPAPSEVDFWAGRLDNGAFRSWVGATMVGSDEAHGHIVDADYLLMLLRGPDAGGRAWWVSQLAKGVPNESIIGLFGGSPEYYASPRKGKGDNLDLILSLYTDILRRTPPASDAGVQFWLGWLAAGHPSSVLATMFANSHEYHLFIVNGWYQHYLGRPSDSQGAEFWATYLDHGHTDDAGILSIVSSPEYFGHPSAF